MKAIIIGGGKGCHSLLGLTTSAFLKELEIDVRAVVDPNPEAPGLVYARSIGLQTFSEWQTAITQTDFELIIELTGSDEILQGLYGLLKPGIRIIDHKIAHIFWDFINIQDEQTRQLKELQRLEMVLENEKRFLQSIFDNLTDLAVVLDKDLKILKINKNFALFAGLRPDDAIGKSCLDVLKHTELKCEFGEITHIMDSIITTGKSFFYVHRTPPPKENHWEISYTPVKSRSGEVEAILSVWHRITERVMLHREIESAEQKFKGFINSAQDWISIKDLEGRYLIVNPVTARAMNLEVDDFYGKKPMEILPKKLAKTIMRHDNEVIKSKQAITYDEIIPIDGQEHNFQTVRFPLNDYKGEVIGVCTIARDVTKEVKLQEQLVQSEKLAALGKLAAGVAHEINNPLTGVLAYAEDLIEEMPQDSLFVDDLQVIIRETLRCRDIVRNLLDFARQEQPKLEVANLVNVIKNTLLLVERLPQFKDISIEKNISKELPTVLLDPKQMQQVLLNLMINATDAMKYKGRLSIASEYDLSQDKCIISVEDTGPGIPENLIDKIFEPFFSTKGTSGLGLAVSWGIVERHRGSIEIDTAESGGAIFRIVLPAYR